MKTSREKTYVKAIKLALQETGYSCTKKELEYMQDNQLAAASIRCKFFTGIFITKDTPAEIFMLNCKRGSPYHGAESWCPECPEFNCPVCGVFVTHKNLSCKCYIVDDLTTMPFADVKGIMSADGWNVNLDGSMKRAQ